MDRVHDAMTARESPTPTDAVKTALRSEGQPLDTGTREFMEPRFGWSIARVPVRPPNPVLGRADTPEEIAAQHTAAGALATPGRRIGGADFGLVRIHTGPSAVEAARAVEARAFTIGHDIVFDAGEFQPDTADGRRLLAHELAHVTHGHSGLRRQPAPGQKDEMVSYRIKIPSGITTRIEMIRYAEIAVFGRPVGRTWSGPPNAEALIAEPAKHVGKEVTFSAPRSLLTRLGTGPTKAEKAKADKDYVELAPEDRDPINEEIDRRYHVGIQAPPGTTIAKGEKGKIEIWNAFKRQVLADKRKLDALPDSVKAILGGPSNFTPSQFEILVRIADKLSGLSEADLEDYRSKTTSTTSDLAVLEKSIDDYLAARAEREKAHERREDLARRLYGIQGLYDEYRALGRAPADLEKRARDKDVQGAGHEAQALRKQASELRKQEIGDFTDHVKEHGFTSVQDFIRTLDAYENAFLDETVAITLGILQKFEHRLFEAEQQYSSNTAIDALIAAARATSAPALVEQARKKIEEARKLSERGRFLTVQGNAHEGNKLSNQAGKLMNEAGDLMKTASGQIRSLPGQPLVADEKFPRAELLTGSTASVKAAIFAYIKARREDIEKCREDLADDKRIVYKLPKILGPSMEQQGVEPGDFLHRLISERRDAYIGDAHVLTVVLALVGFALALLTGGGGAIAVVAALGAFGISTYQAIQEYKEYEQKSAFAGAGLADEPSFAWVIVAIVGAGLDLGAAVSAVHGMATAVRTFNRSKDLADLKVALEALPENVRQSVLRAAVAKLEADEALLAFGAKVSSSAYGGAAGLNALPEFVVALYGMGRRTTISFGTFMKEMKAAKLIDEAKLTAEELTRLKGLFEEARGVVKDVTRAGKELGLTDNEIGGFVRLMAEDASVTAAHVKGAMADLAKTKPSVGAAKAAGKKGPLDVKAQVKAAERLESVDKEILDTVTSAKAETAAAASARTELKALSEAPRAVPDTLKASMDRLGKIKGLEDRIEALDEMRRAPGLTTDEKNFLDWRRSTWALQHEAETAEETAKFLGGRLETLGTAKKVAVEQLRKESKDLIAVLRSYGPNYASKTKTVAIDEVLGETAWKALPSPKPKLATDHLVSVDRLSKLPEMNRLLALYTEAQPAVKEAIRDGIKGLGDRPDNLFRMNATANGSAMKSNKSWHQVTYDDAKKFGYTVADVDKMRRLEDTALRSILDEIDRLVKEFSPQVKGTAASP